MAISRILIANRGAVAARVIRAVHALGLYAIAV
jgi:acetyl/propionyl-CoA carboxylase alpha subunit